MRIRWRTPRKSPRRRSRSITRRRNSRQTSPQTRFPFSASTRSSPRTSTAATRHRRILRYWNSTGVRSCVCRRRPHWVLSIACLLAVVPIASAVSVIPIGKRARTPARRHVAVQARAGRGGPAAPGVAEKRADQGCRTNSSRSRSPITSRTRAGTTSPFPATGR